MKQANKSVTLFGKTTMNAVWSGGGYLFSVVILFITIPLFIRLLGDIGYGVMVLLQTIMVGFALLGFGVAPATVKYVSESISRGDYKEANQFVNSTLCFNLIIGIFGATLIVLLARPMAQKIFKIPESNQLIVQKCFYWVAIGWFLTQIRETLKGISMAFQNFKFVAIGDNLSSALIAVVGLGVLYMGGNLVNLFQANVAVLAVSVIGWWFFAHIVFPRLKIKFWVNWTLFKKTIDYGLWQTLTGLGGMISNSVFKIIIGIFLSPAAVGYYNIPVTICSKIHGGLSSIGRVSFPLISYLQGRNDKSRIYKYFTNGSWIIGLLAVGAYLPLILFSNSFLKLWIGPEFAGKSGNLFVLVVFASLFLSTGIMRYMFVAGVAMVKWNALAAWIPAALGLLLNVILLPKYGLIGAGFAYLSCCVSTIIVAAIVKNRFFSDKRWAEYLYYTYAPAAIAVSIFLISSYFLHIEIGNWFNFVIYCFGISFSIVSLVLFIDKMMAKFTRISCLRNLKKSSLGNSPLLRKYL